MNETEKSVLRRRRLSDELLETTRQRTTDAQLGDIEGRFTAGAADARKNKDESSCLDLCIVASCVAIVRDLLIEQDETRRVEK